MTPPSLQSELDVTVDETVEFTFTVTNAGDGPRELQFRCGLAADIVVRRDAQEVWRWSDGQLFTQARWHEALAPDESVTHEAIWSEPATGAYAAVGRLEAENADVEARAEFSV